MSSIDTALQDYSATDKTWKLLNAVFTVVPGAPDLPWYSGVNDAVRILRLPAFALEELRAGQITADHAKALLPLSEPTVLRKTLREVISRDLSVRATERMVAAIIKPSRRASKPAEPAYQAATEQLSRSLNTRVRIEPRARGKRGKIVIEYFSPEELARLVEQLRGPEEG